MPATWPQFLDVFDHPVKILPTIKTNFGSPIIYLAQKHKPAVLQFSLYFGSCQLLVPLGKAPRSRSRKRLWETMNQRQIARRQS